MSVSTTLAEIPFLPNQTQPLLSVNLDLAPTTSLIALWDSGPSKSYISPSAIPNLSKSASDHSIPINLRLFDRKPSSAGQITQYVDAHMQISPTLEPLPIRFNITSLCDADIVIGSKWMTQQGSIIDFKRCFATIESVKRGLPTKEVLRTPLSNLRNPCTSPNNIPIGIRRSVPIVESVSKLPKTPESPVDKSVATLRAVLRSALEEITLSAEEQLPQPTLTKEEYAELITTEPQFEEPIIFDQAEFDTETAELLKQIPEYLHNYLNIFRQRQGTSSLPPPRVHNMRLDMCPDLPIILPKLYQVTEEQRPVLLETLERELEAGQIVPSRAAYGLPTFFVPKKDGQWRMVVDYRKVNKVSGPHNGVEY